MSTNAQALHTKPIEVEIELGAEYVWVKFKPMTIVEMSLLIRFLTEAIADQVFTPEERANLNNAEILKKCQETYGQIMQLPESEAKQLAITSLFLNPVANEYLEKVIGRCFPQVIVPELRNDAIVGLTNFLLGVLSSAANDTANSAYIA